MAGARLAEIYDLFTSPVLEPLEPGTAGELATARAIVDAHGGTVQARSAGPGKGSEFVVTLPLARD
jgi:signal transduction histidine kinase